MARSRPRSAPLWLALGFFARSTRPLNARWGAEVFSGAVLLGAALVAGTELDQFPSLDHEGRHSELDSLKSSCCDRL